MSPSRKKPFCHQCGSPMEGHKRPNGQPICPSKSPSPPAWTYRAGIPGSPPPRRYRSKTPPSSPPIRWVPGTKQCYRRRNPNWVEPALPAAAQPLQRHDTEISWVATEIDEDVANDNPPINGRAHRTNTTDKEVVVIDEDTTAAESSRQPENTTTASTSRQSSTVSRGISRTFSEIFTGRAALASVFSTTSKDAAAISLAARRRGLYAGFMKDSSGNIRVKEESPFDLDLGNPPQERNLVVVGQDASTVQHVLEAGEERLLSIALESGARPRVGAYPVNPNSIRPTFFDIIIAGAIGGLIVIWVLSCT